MASSLTIRIACRLACMGATLALGAGSCSVAQAQSWQERSLVVDQGIRSHPDPAPAERYRERAQPTPARPAGAAGAAGRPVSGAGAKTSPGSGPRSSLVSRQDPLTEELPLGRTTSPLDQPPYGSPSPGEEGVPEGEHWLFDERWHDLGPIQGEYLYTCDTFVNAHGGINTKDAIRYIGSLDLVFNVDLEKLGGWDGGRLFLFGENVHGRTLTPDDVGDFEFYDEYEPSPRSTPFAQVTEYWLEQKVGERLTFKLGKQDANRDFIFPEFGVDFINSSFSLIPTILPPTYPNTALGFATFYHLNDLVLLRAGVYDGAFFVGHANGGGQWGFESLGHFGAMSLYEAQLRPQWHNGRLPGNYRFGGWHHTHHFPLQGGPPGSTRKGNHGLYVSCDQMLYRENPDDEGDLQGVGCFIQYGYAPYDRNTLEDYVGGGLFFDGFFPGRDEDTMGIAIGQCYFSRNLKAQGQISETSIEVFYKIHVRHWLRVQPELQFIANPGGIHQDCLLPGLRVEMAL